MEKKPFTVSHETWQRLQELTEEIVTAVYTLKALNDSCSLIVENHLAAFDSPGKSNPLGRSPYLFILSDRESDHISKITDALFGILYGKE